MKIKNTCARSGAFLLIDNLVQHGVEHIFGYPGGAILPIYDELYFWEKYGLIKHILVRHEQSAAHAADGYARSSNKIGVCFATSGPGATNLVTGIATAYMDSIPLIVITGQVSKAFIGTDAFQETNIFGITLPIVKHSYTIRNVNLLPQIISEAFFLAQNGRPGPILIDIPKDIGLEEGQHFSYPKFSHLIYKKNYRTDYKTNDALLSKFITYLGQSYQPLIYAGGGILRSNSFNALHFISKLFQIPVTTTLMGKGAFNETDFLALGMLGMHGTAYANFAVNECDLLIALGARFDDRVTGKLDEFACNAEVVHIDIDAAEISKNRSPQLSLIGDARTILIQILKKLRKSKSFFSRKTKDWVERVHGWKRMYPIFLPNQKTLSLLPQELIYQLGQRNKKACYTTDVGQHQMWAAQFINCEPKNWLSSSGLGTMGFGLPAAIGAKIANPHKEIICISGDSSIQMKIQELGTISQYNLTIKIIIINNGWQGMVRQWQQSFYGNRYSNSYMQKGMPNFVKLSHAYNIKGFQIIHIKELETIFKILKDSKESILIDAKVLENENCYPMVSPGRSSSHMLGLKKRNID